MRIASSPSPPRRFGESRGRSSISTPPSARSSRRLAELLLVALTGGCGLAKSGTATVSAQFDEPRCQVDKPLKPDLEDYSFDADYMSTERYSGILLIMIQKHRVNIEETDGLSIRMSIDDLLDDGRLILDAENEEIVRADASVPLSLPVSLDEEGTNAALSLFQSCPDLPVNPALAGELTFSAFNVRDEPEDTGRMEHLAGTLTATLTRSDTEGRVGTLRAAFDFAPPRRPLTDLK